MRKHTNLFLTSKTLPGGRSVATILTMEGEQENMLGLPLLSSLLETLHHLSTDASSQCVILTSAHPIFSSGPDVTILSDPTQPLFRQWYRLLASVHDALLTFPKPIAAAINGHCPSLGCALVLPCDERVMSAGPKEKPHMIGFNDGQLGMQVPPWLVANFCAVTGQVMHKVEKLLATSQMLSAEEAFRYGVVDTIVTHESGGVEGVVEAAIERLLPHLAVPSSSWLMTKAMLRGETTMAMRHEGYAKIVEVAWANSLGLRDVNERISA